MATKVAQKSKDSPKDIKQNKGFFDRLKSRMTDDKRTMLNNLAILIDSGMGIRSALRSLEDNTRHKKLKKQLAKIRGDIEDGKPLWKAFDKHSFAPPYIISLIRIGEKSGNLEEKLEDAVQTLEKEKKHKSQLRSAMFYPTFILFMALIVTIGLTWFVLPRLGRVFNSLNADLPTITKVLLSAGDIMSQYGVYIVPAAFLVVLTIIFFLFFFPPTKGIGQWILFHIPVIHKLIMYTEVSRFSFNLSMLLASGIPLSQAMDNLEEVQEYFMYKRFIRRLSEDVTQGYSFQHSFKANSSKLKNMFPFTVQELIAAGENSGQLPKVLQRIGERYTEKSEEISANMGKLIEPFLLIIVWTVVVFLALAILLPIYNLVGDFSV